MTLLVFLRGRQKKKKKIMMSNIMDKAYGVLLAILCALMGWYLSMPSDEDIQNELYPDLGRELNISLYKQDGIYFRFEG